MKNQAKKVHLSTGAIRKTANFPGNIWNIGKIQPPSLQQCKLEWYEPRNGIIEYRPGCKTDKLMNILRNLKKNKSDILFHTGNSSYVKIPFSNLKFDFELTPLLKKSYLVELSRIMTSTHWWTLVILSNNLYNFRNIDGSFRMPDKMLGYKPKDSARIQGKPNLKVSIKTKDKDPEKPMNPLLAKMLANTGKKLLPTRDILSNNYLGLSIYLKNSLNGVKGNFGDIITKKVEKPIIVENDPKMVEERNKKRLTIYKSSIKGISKKSFYGRTTKSQRLKWAKEELDEINHLDYLERKGLSLQAQNSKPHIKKSIDYSFTEKSIKRKNYLAERELKREKNSKDRFIRTKRSKSVNRLLLNDILYERHVNKKIEEETDEKIRGGKNIKVHHGLNAIDRDLHLKKSMNYVKPKVLIHTKKLRIKDQSKTLVCITNGDTVYRVDRSTTELAMSKLKGFIYTDKAKWKEAKRDGNASYNLFIPTTQVVSQIKKTKSKRNQIKIERKSKYLESYRKSLEFKNKFTNSKKAA